MTKYILTENEIKHIVKESIQEYIENNQRSNIGDYFKEILSHLSDDELNDMFNIGFIKETHIYSPFHPFYKGKGGLHEDLGTSLPLEEVKKEISNKYGLKDYQFRIENACNNVNIAILIPKLDGVVSDMITDMNKLGYFSSKSETIQDRGYTFIVMQFEPLYQEDIRNEISKDGMLYHITPTRNIEGIKANGLIPNSLNTIFDYPDRIYFLISGYNVRELRMFAKGLRDNSSNKNEPYSLVILNLYKVPRNVSFHYDPNFANAVYTYDKVPSSAIVNIIDLKI